MHRIVGSVLALLRTTLTRPGTTACTGKATFDQEAPSLEGRMCRMRRNSKPVRQGRSLAPREQLRHQTSDSRFHHGAALYGARRWRQGRGPGLGEVCSPARGTARRHQVFLVGTGSRRAAARATTWVLSRATPHGWFLATCAYAVCRFTRACAGPESCSVPRFVTGEPCRCRWDWRSRSRGYFEVHQACRL